MKLSKKGLMRLLDAAFDGDEFYQANALEVEFEPDDFVGGCCQNGNDHLVCLTVEEAKILLECAYCVDAYTFTNCKKLFNCLERRIVQAEGGK